ncbi:MAG: hypothetical protein CVV41_19120 [Candidatus Riflebacteria bacterium HGW-Riflebacteria-1]|jgi:hypothetical protein|nr:MAG: hypothetical protein CVV41_19120 [Candidatus Riflebacteria bacterium HGW-Riflebacteria-1]
MVSDYNICIDLSQYFSNIYFSIPRLAALATLQPSPAAILQNQAKLLVGGLIFLRKYIDATMVTLSDTVFKEMNTMKEQNSIDHSQ